jgi:hypothetical protein
VEAPTVPPISKYKINCCDKLVQVQIMPPLIGCCQGSSGFFLFFINLASSASRSHPPGRPIMDGATTGHGCSAEYLIFFAKEFIYIVCRYYVSLAAIFSTYTYVSSLN